MLRIITVVIPLSFVLTACGPTVYRPSLEEVQKEEARLTARSKEYYRQQKERVERIGKQLLAQVPNPPEVEFTVVEGEQSVNAGATFGRIMVTAGMLHFARTDDELAAVLGHELGHHTQSHISEGLATGIITVVAATAAAMALDSVAPGMGRIAGGLIQGTAQHANQNKEFEADEVGLRYAAAAGYNPQAAVDVFERMAIEVPQTLTAEFFTSHPSSPERLLAARKIADSLVASGVYVAKAETTTPAAVSAAVPAAAPASVPAVKSDRPGDEPDDPGPASVPSTSRPAVQAEPTPETYVSLRKLHHDRRAGRISRDEYEAKKRELLNGGE
jgi:metalloendopeptidase OMA1, mitochondrial